MSNLSKYLGKEIAAALAISLSFSAGASTIYAEELAEEENVQETSAAQEISAEAGIVQGDGWNLKDGVFTLEKDVEKKHGLLTRIRFGK